MKQFSCTLYSVHPTVKDEGEMHVKCFFFNLERPDHS